MNFTAMSDKAILAELGERVRRERLNQNISQSDLALRAGVSRIVIQRVEGGQVCTLDGLIKILRAFGKLDGLDVFLPDPGFSPLQLARLSGRHRERASGPRGGKRKEV